MMYVAPAGAPTGPACMKVGVGAMLLIEVINIVSQFFSSTPLVSLD
jgi:hypothetical protein